MLKTLELPEQYVVSDSKLDKDTYDKAQEQVVGRGNKGRIRTRVATDTINFRKRVYIAGPISRGNLADNVNQATEAFVELQEEGFAPFNPMWSVYAKPCKEVDYDIVQCYGTRDGNSMIPWTVWVELCLPWVEVSDLLLRLPGESAGADAEVNTALAKGVPVFYSIEELVRWSTEQDSE